MFLASEGRFFALLRVLAGWSSFVVEVWYFRHRSTPRGPAVCAIGCGAVSFFSLLAGPRSGPCLLAFECGLPVEKSVF